MATLVKPETEEKLARLSERLHRPKDEVLDEAVSRLLEYQQLLQRREERNSEGNSSEIDLTPVEIKGEPLSATVIRERR